MKISALENAGKFTFRVNIGETFGEKPEAIYIVLGEPTMKEYDLMQRKDDLNAGDMAKLMKGCIIDHNIENEKGDPATPDQVMALLDKFPAVFSEVTEAWQDELPLVKRSREKSKNSAPEPSES